MLEWIVKKIVISKLNGLLKDYDGDIRDAEAKVSLWLDRLDLVESDLRKILTRLDDGEITKDELYDTVEDIKGTIKEW